MFSDNGKFMFIQVLIALFYRYTKNTLKTFSSNVYINYILLHIILCGLGASRLYCNRSTKAPKIKLPFSDTFVFCIFLYTKLPVVLQVSKRQLLFYSWFLAHRHESLVKDNKNMCFVVQDLTIQFVLQDPPRSEQNLWLVAFNLIL